MAAFIAVSLVVVLAAGGWFARQRRGDDDGPLRGAEQRPAPALVADDDPTNGSIAIVGSGPVPGPVVEVTVTSPPGSTQMQIGTDPTFATTVWTAVEPSISLVIADTGHQMVFGRFRSGDGGEPTVTRVDDVVIDPTYEQATSSSDGRHEPSWVRPLSASTVMVRVEAGRLQLGAQEPYDFDAPPAGDDVDRSGDRSATVRRDGEPYGRRVDGGGELLRPYDQLIGQPLDVDALREGEWTLSSDAPGFGPAVTAHTVEYISRPSGSGRGVDGERVTALVHDFIVQWPSPIEPGQTYLVTPPGESVEPIGLTWDPDATVSPAVHVNQAGYGRTDPLKVGYLSGLFDDIGALSYAVGSPFWLVDVATGERRYDGMAAARPGGDELGKGDLTGTPVLELDFSTFDRPGDYQLCVEAVGCSVPFGVGDDRWLPLATDVARAMYHQRSGVALGPPFTSIARPRPYHPDDGMVVQAAELSLLDSTLVAPELLFTTLVESGTTTEVADAWGGHFDAGDWDRRIQHLYWVRAVAETVEMYPDRFAELDLNIPESGDRVPDLLDEGLWTLDFFARLQGADGSIRGGVEASEHPQADATSWSDDLAVFAYAPDVWSSYLYAGVAAQVADILEPYDAVRAARYTVSATAAMSWADSQPHDAAHVEVVTTERSVAAAALFKLTGEDRYHQIFVETTALLDPNEPFPGCHAHGGCDAGWIYLTTDPADTDPEIRSTIEQGLLARADSVVGVVDGTAFGWALEHPDVPLVWGLGVGGSPNAVALVRAYEISGDERYRRAALRSAAVTLGANPTNTVYLTGTGHYPVRSPLIVDVWNGGLPVWAGTPIYGNHDIGALADESWIDEFVLGSSGVVPVSAEVPYLWQWYDVSDVAVFNEYTVFQSHAQAVYAFGFLAGASS